MENPYLAGLALVKQHYGTSGPNGAFGKVHSQPVQRFPRLGDQ